MPETLTDTQPLTAFVENPDELLQQLKITHCAITLTVDGQPAVILLNPAEYQRLRNLAARASVKEGIRQGLEDVAAGRTRRVAHTLGAPFIAHFAMSGDSRHARTRR